MKSMFRIAQRASLWVLVFVLTMWLLPSPGLSLRWNAATNKQIPKSFQYAMYPKSATVPLFDTPNGTEIGTLTRAVVNEQAEVDGQDWIAVRDHDATHWVRRDDLSFAAESLSKQTDLWQGYRHAFLARNPGENIDATLTDERRSDGQTYVVLQLTQRDQKWKYVYQSSADQATPLEMFYTNSKAQALQWGANLFLAAFLATFVVFLAWMVAAVVAVFQRTKKLRSVS